METTESSITISKNGPYLVSGDVPVTIQTITPDSKGGSWTWTGSRSFEVGPKYALCRCGHSNNKPFCDGTHAKIGFDGTETARREPIQLESIVSEGAAMVLEDAEALCAAARFCDNHGGIWDLVARADSPGNRELIRHEATHCPSGRLVIRDRATRAVIEPHLPRSIGIVEDPGMECSGPLWIRGGVPIRTQDGEAYEVRNRVTLCRCGKSQNKPFCDGSHTEGFNDGLL